MGNVASTAYEYIQPLLMKLSDSMELENITRKDVSLAIAAILGIYYGGSFVAKCYKAHRARKMLEGIPNHPNILNGNLNDFPGPGPKIFDWVISKVKQHGKFYQFWIGPFNPLIQLCHPDTAKIILKSSEPKKINQGGNYSVMEEWLGDGLLMSSGPKWLRNRRLLTPAFHFEILKPYLNVYQVATEKFLNKMASMSDDGKTAVPIYAFVSLLTLDIILKCAFSYEGDTQGQGKSDPYVASVLKLTDSLITRVFSPFLRYDLIWNLSPAGRESARTLKHVHQVSEEVIERRKKTLAENPDAPRKRYLDFLDILLSARDGNGQGLTSKEIRDEVDTFLFEGHDTTAAGISWTLYHLAQHPEAQERVRQEVNSVMGTDGTLEWADLSRLPFLTQCIKESMRVHPPVPVIGRQLSKDIVINGVTVPKYTNVQVTIYGLHHNPLVWGEDHMEFKPERFDPENLKNKDAYDYVPFSAGPRNCIGQNFALNEEKVVIAKVIQKFEITVDRSHKVEFHPEFVIRPTNDIKLFFRPMK